MDTIYQEIEFIKVRNKIISDVTSLATKIGYIKVESDYFEDYITYLKQNTRQHPKKLVKVPDLQGNMYVLQPDITTNIIKQIIPLISPNFKEKFFYLDNIFSFNEDGCIEKTRQFGVEVIGKKDIDAELELIEFIQQVFSMLKLPFVLEIGNQKWIEDIIKVMKLTEEDAGIVREALLSKNKTLLDEVLKDCSLLEYKKLLQYAIQKQNDIRSLKEFIVAKNLDSTLVIELNRMIDLKERLKIENIVFDMSLINPFDYYNGPIFRGYIYDIESNVFRG